jgi:hypothetical protein
MLGNYLYILTISGFCFLKTWEMKEPIVFVVWKFLEYRTHVFSFFEKIQIQRISSFGFFKKPQKTNKFHEIFKQKNGNFIKGYLMSFYFF